MYSPKSGSEHVSSATEYVLVYAKDDELATTALQARTAEMDSRYHNPDNDPEGAWKKSSDATAKDPSKEGIYALQSPFTGELYEPPGGRHWSNSRATMKAWIEGWGSEYEFVKTTESKGGGS